jgi:hypothetical protein
VIWRWRLGAAASNFIACQHKLWGFLESNCCVASVAISVGLRLTQGCIYNQLTYGCSSGFGMWILLRNVVFIATLLGWLCVPAQAPAQQKPAIESWAAIGDRTSGIVLIIDANVASFSVSSADKTVIEADKWSGGPLVRQYRVSPDLYQIAGLPEPASYFGVHADQGSLTYVRLSPYRSPEGVAGVQITSWSGGPVPGDVASLLADAFSKGIPDAYKTPETSSRVLFVATEPPWKPPPPPPPRK